MEDTVELGPIEIVAFALPGRTLDAGVLAQMRASITPQLSEPWTAKGPGNGDPGSAFVDKDGDGECDQMPEGGRGQMPAGGRGMQRGRMGR